MECGALKGQLIFGRINSCLISLSESLNLFSVPYLLYALKDLKLPILTLTLVFVYGKKTLRFVIFKG